MKLKLYLLALLGALLTDGCASKNVTVTRSQELPGLVGRRVTIVGTAVHSCPGAMVLGEHVQVYIEGMKNWPSNYEHWAVQATGLLMEHRSIHDLYVIRNPRWKALGVCGSTDAAQIREIQRLMQSERLPSNPSEARILYHNAQYNFMFFLPASWQGYSVVVQQWMGQTYLLALDEVVTEHGPVIFLRHPQWKASDPYQDIPILMFTRSQWAAHRQGKISIGAGGVEYEIGHNSKYVFAISSRFNADDSVKGWKEATDIVGQNCAAGVPHLFPDI